MSDTQRQNGIVGTRDESGLVSWRTDSDMSVLFVNGRDLPTVLTELADILEQQSVSGFAIDLQFNREDDDTYTVGLVLEEVPWL